jgi:predicted Rossmann-fold nucleotide-binding protein
VNSPVNFPVLDTQISPEGILGVLSKAEVSKLLDSSHGGLYPILRHCTLAVMNSGNAMDNGKELLARYPDFSISIIERERGIKLDIKSAPASAFVDGVMIKGIQEHVFAVVRDIIFLNSEIEGNPEFDLTTTHGITDAVFHILRNANLLQPLVNPNLVVCWGGHSISGNEYDYTKHVGYQLGLRGLNICTGCGPGAMKGPMKGATIGHAKQRQSDGRYLGVTEPGIIAAEAPNAIVNELVILPDIEKRLEAFVRLCHAVIVFPGGAGTAEEILYILGVLLHPDNAALPFPLIFTGPPSAAAYFEQIDQFIGSTLGPGAQSRYQIIIDNPELVAQQIQVGISQVRAHRKSTSDAYYFNWSLKVPSEFQQPFEPTHQNMQQLQLHTNQQNYLLAANLRRAFSGIVAGNVKEAGMASIEKHGLFELRGETALMESIDALLTSFVQQQRMKLPGKQYVPCYRVVK